MNPRVGSGMQQAHEPPVEEAVAVVRNHEDGTSTTRGSVGPKAAEGQPFAAGSGHRPVMSMEGRSLVTLKEALGSTSRAAARCAFERAARRMDGWTHG
jgi:hypothetical protein